MQARDMTRSVAGQERDGGEEFGAGPNFVRIVVLLIFAASLLPIFVSPIYPLIDYYNHIARYFVMAHIPESSHLRDSYDVNWQILPNIGLDYVGQLLMGFLPPMAVAKVIVGAICTLQFWGVLALHRALGGRSPILVALLSSGLLYSYVLNWGFSNFLLGLSLAIVTAAVWLLLRSRPILALPVCAVLALLIFATHAFAFGVYGLVVGGLELGLWLKAKERRVVALVRPMLLLAAQAVIPMALFAISPTSSNEGGIIDIAKISAKYGADQGALARKFLVEGVHRLTSVVRVSEGPSFQFDLILMALVAGVGVLLLLRRRISINAAVWPALAILGLLLIATPPSVLKVGYVAERLPLAMFLVLAASVNARFASRREQQAVVGGLAALALLRLVAVSLDWASYGATYAQFQRLSTAIPQGALVAALVVNGDDQRDGFRPRCQMYAPLTAITRGAVTPVFAEVGKQPIAQIGPLARAQGHFLSQENPVVYPRPYFYDEQLASLAAPGGFEYLIICGRERLLRPLPANLHLIGRAGPVELYSAK